MRRSSSKPFSSRGAYCPRRIGLDRRDFLHLSGLAALWTGTPLLGGCGGDEQSGGAQTGLPEPSTQPPAGTPPPAGELVPVGIVRSADIEFMVREAIERAGGLSGIAGGDRVIIKPNTVTNLAVGGVRVTTHPRVLAAVIDAVKMHTDARNIIVADCTAMGFPTLPTAEAVGFTAVTEAARVPFVGWETLPYKPYLDPDWTTLSEAKFIPAMVHPESPEYDHFINVPMLKNHEQIPDTNVDFTCCLKNFVGMIKWDGPNSRIGGQDIHSAELGTKAGEMGRFVRNIKMNVVDAISVVLTNGPAGWKNQTRDITVLLEPHEMELAPEVGLVIASRDRVAADSLAFATLKYYAKQHGVDRPYVGRAIAQQSQIKRAAELGLGTHLLDALAIEQDNVPELDGILAGWS